ncbi:Leucyl-tRNA synthetase, mitochondrial [Mycoemilia scoparia]|uniref:leucine--tRNA ligase n=1 Tax=Mycoemilia scoparia TaxID=417184 RepID=A0A9W8A8W6_9FUNG|nr:Leucyl-tRNA synthetase, mitochondrial [Mycoemilia scoparia]
MLALRGSRAYAKVKIRGTPTQIGDGSRKCYQLINGSMLTKALYCASRQASTETFSKWINQDGKIDHASIEDKWKKRWNDHRLLLQNDERKDPFYVLAMFPYPSGALHMGHVRVYTISDVVSRYNRMLGKKVLHPMGWDAFGLPAENAAIERQISPAVWTKQNIASMKDQLKSMLTDFNWEKEISTCDTKYYKWTQYLFLQLYKHNLVYQKEATVNWDPVDQTVLANEQVDSNGRSWRSGAIVEKRKLKQWFVKISSYADELLEGLGSLKEWPTNVLQMQENWIGKSKGAIFHFNLEGHQQNAGKRLSVFTSRPDTLFGVSYIAISCDHPLVSSEHLTKEMLDKIAEFSNNLSRIPTSELATDRRGINTGLFATHPIVGSMKVPIYVAAYVLPDYGSGAVMGVPAHDIRDHSFAQANNIPFTQVIKESDKKEGGTDLPFTNLGVLKNIPENGEFSGMPSRDAQNAIVEKAKSLKTGDNSVQYRIRDWLISRQRYWGAPIPIIHCKSCGAVPVPEDQLPVELPTVVEIKGRGGSPLQQSKDWVNTQCPKCSKPATRDTDTMDTFVDSSWYFMRFPDANNDSKIFDPKTAAEMLPVDIYIGGVEHAILHLLYSRFISRFLTNTEIGTTDKKHSANNGEPFKRLLTQGMVHGKTFKDPDTGRFLKPDEVTFDHSGNPKIVATGETPLITFEKMSKSKYNGVDPVKTIKEFGADTTRLHILYRAAPQDVLEWETQNIVGMERWLSRLGRLVDATLSNPPKSIALRDLLENRKEWPEKVHEIYCMTNQAIQKVTNTFADTFAFNTAIAALVTLTNLLQAEAQKDIISHPIFRYSVGCIVRMLSPMAPGIGEELWELLKTGCNEEKYPTSLILLSHESLAANHSIFSAPWPKVDEAGLISQKITTIIQVNGKVRGKLLLSANADINAKDLHEKALQNPSAKKWLMDDETGNPKLVKKTIIVKGAKLVNFIV